VAQPPNENTALVWLSRDLRLADNPALARAAASGVAVIPVFIWAPEEEAPWAPGSASRWWLKQSLDALSGALRQRGSQLIVRRGPTVEALLALATETGARTVYWNRRYEPRCMARAQQIEQRLLAAGIATESCEGNVLFEPGTILNSQGRPFQVFTAFWKACQSRSIPPGPTAAPQRLRAPRHWPTSLAAGDLNLEPKIDWAGGIRESWQPGEDGAARHMQSFLKRGAGAYPVERDRPDHPGTSRLSPHLAFGEISARTVWHRAARAEGYLRQLAWREFAYHLLYHFPHTANEPLRAEFRRFPWQLDPAAFDLWSQGRTGYPLVDAGMRELWHTGWMHNRVRMVAASFLVKHLLIPWQDGAAWFWDTLVDADLANNTMGWQWTAGCGADAAPYFRIFNPTAQAAKFDPQGDYVRRWVPESGTPAYPPPMVSHAAARERALAAFAETRTPR
jgi:deoxyribodipyrimidine photo-lyase